MKTLIPIVLLTVILVTVASFELHRPTETKEQVGLQIVTALQRSSAHEFSALFPTLADFHQLMARNAELYGQNLSEAALEFEKEFERVIYPEFEKSFERIVEEGRKSGIDWSTVKFVSVEVPEGIDPGFASVPMTVNFTAQGKAYRLKIGKALLINGHWKISQHISLES